MLNQTSNGIDTEGNLGETAERLRESAWAFLSTAVASLLVHKLETIINIGATCGVTVSMSAFLACHQCYCAGLSLAWGLSLRAVVCGIF